MKRTHGLVECWNVEGLEQWEIASLPSLQYSIIPILKKSPMIPMMQESNETALAPELKLISGARVKVSEPLARYTSIKVGGPADFFIEVENAAALTQVLSALNRYRTGFFLLGNGSNVLISDQGMRGAVIHLAGRSNRLSGGKKTKSSGSGSVRHAVLRSW